ncbi:MAG: hypothetical protein RBS56_01530 [Candidatus Gracilibacteria bacterium]|jgi:hypothetical protein|nr:hypothetical protein [Candidatus Gracilibacteria bacterium]
MNNLSEKIIEKIEKDGIFPKPKWEFLLKDTVLWVSFVLSVLMGAVSISVILFFVKTGDLDIYESVYGSVFSAVAGVIPFFWVLLLLGFSIIAFLNFKFTDRGYKMKYVYVFLTSIFLSLTIGALFFQSGMAKWFHGQLTDRLPFYDIFQPRHELKWMRPSEGLLVGVVVGFESEFVFEFKDLERKTWLVDIKKAKIPKRFRPEISSMIKVLGRKVSEEKFEAFDLRPFERPAKGLKMLLEPSF